jgi:hypothetical protein
MLAPHMAEAALVKALEWVVDVDPAEMQWTVNQLREQRPGLDPSGLARHIFSRARWKAAATGVATGLPANPWVMFPAAVADATAVLRIEAKAAAKTALIYDPRFFDDENARWELLVPLFGLHTTSQFLRELGILGSMGVTREVIRKAAASHGFCAVRNVAAKYLGVQLTQRAVVSKVLPVVGGAIGGAWNYAEVTLLGRRCINYFSGNISNAA